MRELRNLVREYDQLRDKFAAVSGQEWEDLTVYRVLDRDWWLLLAAYIAFLVAGVTSMLIPGVIRVDRSMPLCIIEVTILMSIFLRTSFGNGERARKYRKKARIVRCFRPKKWISEVEAAIDVISNPVRRVEENHESWVERKVEELRKTLEELNQPLQDKLRVRIDETWATEKCIERHRCNCERCVSLKRGETPADCWRSLEARSYFKITLWDGRDLGYEPIIRIDHDLNSQKDDNEQSRKVFLLETNEDGYKYAVKTLTKWSAERYEKQIIRLLTNGGAEEAPVSGPVF